MNWLQLLSARRFCSDGSAEPELGADEPPMRTDFQRDADRIIFSPAFRRLKDKTQVFPLPENDLIHSRLTHSTEVAVVGRSLGFAVGRELPARHPQLAATSRELARSWAQDLADVVAAACLAHDIGNPPFGHAGEDAIARYFGAAVQPAAGSRRGELGGHSLTAAQWADLVRFEGNAQGFRILTRLHDERNLGMRLTAATLGAFTKYPCESGADPEAPADPPGSPSQCPSQWKKHGFFQSERRVFQAVANELGLLPAPGPLLRYCRHPLAFLVEAADDISYRILDLEDGLRLNLVPRHKGIDALCEIAKKTPRFVRPDESDSGAVEQLRARAIKQLIIEVYAAFLDCEARILAGRYPGCLLDEVPSAPQLEAIRQLTETCCYRSRGVLEIELAGYHLIGALLHEFIPAAVKPAATRSQHEDKLLALLGMPPSESCPYERALRVTDYIASMTDGYAVTLYRRLKGISLPGAGR
ncbi:MAG TPA: dNTP triphosphohydrolase [Pseudomonadota bacterium]|nr:dNTP triphosphohydrolase [Pseudomonadota bacterium]